MDQPNYAVATLVESPKGIPLVRDPKKPAPLYWKLPGGRSEKGESAIEAAVRELHEEIGIILQATDLKLIHQETRENHVFALFKTTLSSFFDLQKKGGEGEDIKIFTLDQIVEMQDFFPPHKKVLRELGFFL